MAMAKIQNPIAGFFLAGAGVMLLSLFSQTQCFARSAPLPKKIVIPTQETGKPQTRPPLRWRKSFSIGITNLTYSQTAVDPFTQKLITIKGGVEIPITDSRWSIGTGFFFNAFELSNTGQYQLKILGINFRLGRFLTAPESRIQVRFNGGVYYNTSLSVIGFKNMLGPQIFPELSYRISNQRSVLVYVKYSPVLVAGGIDIIRNRELATGIYFRQALASGSGFFAGIDIAGLDAAAGLDEARVRSVSFGIGFGF
jgi:hypothetical protein